MSDAAARRLTIRRVAETVALVGSGAALAGAAGSLLDITVAAAIVGGANGAISGWRGIYRWRSITGWLAFVLDSTWALVTTAGALVAHVVAAVQRTPDNYVAELSERRDRHVYRRGYTLRRGFMFTVGNVINGAGPNTGTEFRRRVVDDHEHVHVWQGRWFGPIFPLVYGAWWVIGATVGTVVWLVRRPPEGFGRVIDSWGYYRNPFEWWAYSREGRWPPPGAVRGFVWRRPLTRPIGTTAAGGTMSGS